jgi:hypothetical protein
LIDKNEISINSLRKLFKKFLSHSIIIEIKSNNGLQTETHPRRTKGKIQQTNLTGQGQNTHHRIKAPQIQTARNQPKIPLRQKIQVQHDQSHALKKGQTKSR